MSSITVYGVPGSPYLRSALLGLEEKGLAYRLHAMGFGEAKSPEHLARHPFGRIPVLEHDDFRLYEAQAILRYLDRIVAAPPLVPPDARLEARMNQLVGINDWYLMPDVSAGISFQRLVAPRFGMPVDEAKLARCLPRASVCIGEVARLLGEQRFMAGDAPSIADLMLAPHFDFFAQTEEGRPMLAEHASLAAWLERMRARPSMTATTWDRLRQRGAAA